jgi:hypothetical protein
MSNRKYVSDLEGKKSDPEKPVIFKKEIPRSCGGLLISVDEILLFI